MENKALLERLTQAQAVSGHEGELRRMIAEETAPFADEMYTDALGNLVALKRGTASDNSKKIMFAAHMDEIGFMVKKIDDNGLIRVCNVGWNWVPSVYNSRVRFKNGITGVVGCVTDTAEAKNDAGKLFIDIGAKDKADAEKYVRVGDVCGYCGEFIELQNGLVTSKSLDNRIGCFMLIEALKRNDGSYPNDVYYVFTVQEEVGCRGSKVAAERIHPDVGVAIDITPAHDYPCDLEGSNTVGAGAAVKFADPSVLCDETVIDTMLKCCEKDDIPYQRDVIDRGGTDASSINLSGIGVRCGGISVVTRNPHSQSCIASLNDIDAAIRLCESFSKAEIIFD